MNVRAAGETISDLVKVIDLHPCVPIFFRIEDDVRSLLAGAETHVGFYFDISEPFSFNSLLKFGHECSGHLHTIAEHRRLATSSLMSASS